jgi:hypothetical protein
MPLKGEIKRATPFTIEVDNNSALSCAITVQKINRRERMTNVDPTTVAAGAAGQVINEQVGLGIDRLIIDVNPGEGCRVTVRVNQGAQVATSDDCQGDARLVFDAIT